jgi:hypothetical protein
MIDLEACLPSELIWNNRSYSELLGVLGRGISPVARPLPIQNNTSAEENGWISMPQVELEPTIPVFELEKIFHVLDGAATVTGSYRY